MPNTINLSIIAHNYPTNNKHKLIYSKFWSSYSPHPVLVALLEIDDTKRSIKICTLEPTCKKFILNPSKLGSQKQPLTLKFSSFSLGFATLKGVQTKLNLIASQIFKFSRMYTHCHHDHYVVVFFLVGYSTSVIAATQLY